MLQSAKNPSMAMILGSQGFPLCQFPLRGPRIEGSWYLGLSRRYLDPWHWTEHIFFHTVSGLYVVAWIQSVSSLLGCLSEWQVREMGGDEGTQRRLAKQPVTLHHLPYPPPSHAFIFVDCYILLFDFTVYSILIDRVSSVTKTLMWCTVTPNNPRKMGCLGRDSPPTPTFRNPNSTQAFQSNQPRLLRRVRRISQLLLLTPVSSSGADTNSKYSTQPWSQT
jgi:hypothetical protein